MALTDARCRADSLDNAACEGFFGRLKTELFYPRDWRATTVDQFIEVVDSYIRWYNAKRIKGLTRLAQPDRIPEEPRNRGINQSKVLAAPPSWDYSSDTDTSCMTRQCRERPRGAAIVRYGKNIPTTARRFFEKAKTFHPNLLT